MRMMVELSRLLDAYGLDVWVWYPAMDRDYTDPATVDSALHEWGEVFRQLPRIDSVFVPGGDPGHTAPQPLMDLLAKETEVLHRYHPRAQMWVSRCQPCAPLCPRVTRSATTPISPTTFNVSFPCRIGIPLGQ